MDKLHNVVVSSKPSKNQNTALRDVQVTCSCGLVRLLPQGTYKEATALILNHRITVIEEILEIEINIDYTPD